MKVFIAIFAFCLAGALANITPEQKEKLKEYKSFCIGESGVDEAVVESAKNQQIADDDKLACFFSCLLKKIGIMNGDGTINEEVTRQKVPSSVPKEKVDEIINKCKSLKGANDCETAKLVMKCYAETKNFNLLI